MDSKLVEISDFPGAFDSPEESVDLRHVNWLCDVLLSCPFQRTLEIGCGNGASATAFCEALSRDGSFHAHFCDPGFRPSFHGVILRKRVRSGKIHLHNMRSCEFIQIQAVQGFDFVFVDGDHSLETVRSECQWLLKMRPAVVMAHDTTCRIRGRDFDWCDGPEFLKWSFQDAGYFCLEDSQYRPGEYTDRGMFAATTYSKWCAPGLVFDGIRGRG
jgi:hypothetical protein